MAKKLSADQIQELKESSRFDFQTSITKYAEKVKDSRSNYSSSNEIQKNIKSIEKDIDKRGICYLSDIANILRWEKGKDTPKRNELQTITNALAISGSEDRVLIHRNFFTATANLLLEDYDNPTEAFLSKKEARKFRKRKRIEKKHGERPTTKSVSKTDDQKKIASRIRRLKRKAKAEGITLEAYMEANGYNEQGLKS